ncbi:ABC transporter ATP-binding protein [Polynucleobacter sp. SHI8]|uniref:ABC transporter ATP-binding protein n=1 Tax=unclassified Polynucleobacter TaxID=2640945 RepID=UPI002492E64B|nr:MULTISPECIES: ABC transporter ATP-binding protein [unclassified Polynucleobacter]BDW11592.1 ABC transporter ATP-binding protein [Polynucleobacter sp. SHI2]BDW14039.1 ABC transporter ATP-binding protein [Polynucleobacter sp. SHI8]
MLELKNIQVAYGPATALWDVSLNVQSGELVCVVGPNAAGKTTLINAIAGLNPLVSGMMQFNGQDMAKLPAHQFCDAGIALVPESRRLFVEMSVLENLELGSYIARAKAQRAQTLEMVLELFPILKEKINQVSGALSGGQQQMVAIGRALMAKPKLLLLDEPSLGLAPSIVIDMFAAIKKVNQEGISVLLVEQNVSMALEIASRGYVLEEGRVVAEGVANELLNSPQIQKAYLGIHS